MADAIGDFPGDLVSDLIPDTIGNLGSLLSWASPLATYTNASAFARSIWDGSTYYDGGGAWTAGVPATVTIGGKWYIQIEETGTNTCVQSEDATTTWTLLSGGTSVTANQSSKFGGLLVGDEIAFEAIDPSGITISPAQVSDNVDITGSVFAWADSNTTFRIGLRDQAGTLTWSANLTATTAPQLFQLTIDSGVFGSLPEFRIANEGGNTGTIYVAKMQFEVGSHASSRIPTAGTAVTRNADVMSFAAVPAGMLTGRWSVNTIPFSNSSQIQHDNYLFYRGAATSSLRMQTTPRAIIRDASTSLINNSAWDGYATLGHIIDMSASSLEITGYTTPGTDTDVALSWADGELRVGCKGGGTNQLNGLLSEPEAA